MQELLDHLRRLEEQLFDPVVRSSRQDLEKLLAPDFREIGSSGRLFDFEDIVTALSVEEPLMSRTLHNLRLVMLAASIALVTYSSTRKTADDVEINSLRSSVWRQENDGRWRMVFHQGTLSHR